MPITREKKEQLLEEYKKRIEKSPALVFTNYRGTTVSQVKSLRAKLSETDTSYMVVKNSLLGLALSQLGRSQPEELLSGPNAVAFVGEDIGKSVTALLDWIKAEKIVEVSGALLGDSVLDANSAQKLADLPTKEQVLAQVLGALMAPGGSLARTINAPMASLVRVINARVEQQQGGAAPAAE